jgi:hypothetical protein
LPLNAYFYLGSGRPQDRVLYERVVFEMQTKEKYRTLIDLEKLNSLNAEGCLACGKKFTLGEGVVLARGKWQGFKYIHENEAVFDQGSRIHYERKHYQAAKRAVH